MNVELQKRLLEAMQTHAEDLMFEMEGKCCTATEASSLLCNVETIMQSLAYVQGHLKYLTALTKDDEFDKELVSVYRGRVVLDVRAAMRHTKP